MLRARYDCKTAVIGSDIYVVGGYGEKETIYNVELYNNYKIFGFYKTEHFNDMEDFRMCSFKHNYSSKYNRRK